MIESIFEILQIPDSAKLNRRIPKKQFFERLPMSKVEKTLFGQAVEKVILHYTIKPDTLNIPTYEDETKRYDEIHIMTIYLKDQMKWRQVARMIHRIPYPLILLFAYETKFCIHTLQKRKNRNDATQLTAEEEETSEWIDQTALSEIDKAFLQSISFSQLPLTHLFAFYKAVTEQIIAYRAAKLSGSLKKSKDFEEQKALLKEFDEKQMELKALKSSMKKEKQFNRKVELNMQIKALSREIEQMKKRL